MTSTDATFDQFASKADQLYWELKEALTLADIRILMNEIDGWGEEKVFGQVASNLPKVSLYIQASIEERKDLSKWGKKRERILLCYYGIISAQIGGYFLRSCNSIQALFPTGSRFVVAQAAVEYFVHYPHHPRIELWPFPYPNPLKV